jgi:hypothetical protein
MYLCILAGGESLHCLIKKKKKKKKKRREREEDGEEGDSWRIFLHKTVWQRHDANEYDLNQRQLIPAQAPRSLAATGALGPAYIK